MSSRCRLVEASLKNADFLREDHEYEGSYIYHVDHACSPEYSLGVILSKTCFGKVLIWLKKKK
jgi:hypothetical protein